MAQYPEGHTRPRKRSLVGTAPPASGPNRPNAWFPEGFEYDAFVRRRHLVGRIWLTLFMGATLVGIIALSALLITVIDDALGYVALQNKIDEDDLILGYYKEKMRTATPLETVPTADLVAILAANITPGRLRALEAEQPLSERTAEEVVDLVRQEVVKPTIVESWSLFDSLLHRTEIEAEVAQIPNAELVFYSWVNPSFVTSPQSSQPEKAGIRTAILGSIWVTLMAMIVALPIGIGAAVYLEEYGRGSWLDRLIETNINNLAGVPSIIYGMLGLGIFVRALEGLTSGTMFGASDPTTANGRTIISAALTLALLVLPLVIINSREAIRAVPRAFREASFGLGATRWQTVWNHVLPSALPGILTGTILALGRVMGETAPLIVVGVSTYIVVDPSDPFSKFTTLPAQIYQWTSRPQEEFVHLAAAGIVVLLVLFLLLNATAIALRNRFARRY